jgi:predicted transcriptional regulator
MKEQVAQIVAAFLKRNQVPSTELRTLIASVSQSLATLGQAPIAPAPLSPAVSIRRSVTADEITCLECGREGQMLKRHLMTAHDLTVDEYRARWSLPRNYPMVAKNYSARRSEIAKSAGLGTPAGRRMRK